MDVVPVWFTKKGAKAITRVICRKPKAREVLLVNYPVYITLRYSYNNLFYVVWNGWINYSRDTEPWSRVKYRGELQFTKTQFAQLFGLGENGLSDEVKMTCFYRENEYVAIPGPYPENGMTLFMHITPEIQEAARWLWELYKPD